ncbi:hypothetical protein N3Z16_04385 [Candidatus Megaera polyxenophila]|uniref:hypothetical protein n=1 Tax=Candidatus Megaera polyxenophila TaxID=988779 RepID=UPI00249E0103|nr:hypothetical protein N3Z16_05530 [Candidatus Megaera polyxenophila]WHA07354.1 hypothetical protein N3Z16_04385 [Candidatus Megaera polyxenophila]
MVNFRRKNILHFIVFFIVGLLIGSMLTLKYADHAGRSHVVYIAREELLNLEKERIRASGEKDLFFGMIGNELQKLIEETVMAYKSRQVKIIYSSYGGITGSDVRSISGEVHAKIIQTLQSKSNKEDKATPDATTK